MEKPEPKTFVFVLMPFTEDFNDVYEVGIKPACENAGAYCERVDEQLFDESILERVYNQIAQADIIVSEMTGRNPNVFYETGYAHALKKRVILLTKNEEDIPFDLKHYQHIIYEGRIALIKSELEKRIRWCIENPKTYFEISEKSGIQSIVFSREDLDKKYSLTSTLENIKADSELLVIARSCEAWAREYHKLQDVVNKKSVYVKMAMVDPNISNDQWMIKSDYAQLDIDSTLSKLQKIKIEPTSNGKIELFWLPNSPLFSFIHYVNEAGENIGILEAGASLPLNERTILIFRSTEHKKGIMLERLYKIYSRTIEGREPALVLKHEV